jgi:hypothetical protein
MMGHCQSYIAVPFFWTERLSSIGRKFSNDFSRAYAHTAARSQDSHASDVAEYVIPKQWPANREQRARIIGEWLRAEARFLASPSIIPE